MARVFIVDDREHPDPDPTRTIEQVRDMFADFYPDLANATHTVTPRGDDQVVEFRRTVGTKGATRRIPPPPKQCRCGGNIIVTDVPDVARCDDCNRMWTYERKYGWTTP